MKEYLMIEGKNVFPVVAERFEVLYKDYIKSTSKQISVELELERELELELLYKNNENLFQFFLNSRNFKSLLIIKKINQKLIKSKELKHLLTNLKTFTYKFTNNSLYLINIDFKERLTYVIDLNSDYSNFADNLIVYGIVRDLRPEKTTARYEYSEDTPFLRTDSFKLLEIGETYL